MEYDSVVSSVISAFQKRAEIGQIKYGKTVDSTCSRRAYGWYFVFRKIETN
jgi:hypothetical protein